MSTAKICDMCGGSGYSTSILTCCLCKINSEHIYCRLAMTANVPEFWYCDECLANADVNRKMQALDAEEGRTIKKSTEGLPSFPIFSPTLKQPKTQNNKSSRLEKKSCNKEDDGFQTHEYRFQSSVCHPNNYSNGREILLTGKSCWMVTFQVADGKFCARCEVDVHFPVNLSHKAWEYSKRMPKVLKLEVMPRSDVWPKIFKEVPPTIDDIGLLFFPARVGRSLESYGHLLNYIESRDAALRYCIVDGELLIYTSKQLSGGADLKYFWGAFRVVRRKESYHKTLLNIMDRAIPPFPTGYSPFSRHGGPESAKEKFTKNQEHE